MLKKVDINSVLSSPCTGAESNESQINPNTDSRKNDITDRFRSLVDQGTSVGRQESVQNGLYQNIDEK